MMHDLTVVFAAQWLKAKGCTLWWDWDITETDERWEAAEAFVDAIREFDLYVIERMARAPWVPPSADQLVIEGMQP